MSVHIVHPLRLEWTEGGAKHTVEWNFRGSQRDPVIKAIFKAVKDAEEAAAAKDFESLRDLNPEHPLTCPRCLQTKRKKNRKAKPRDTTPRQPGEPPHG